MISPGKLNLSFMPEELIGISMANGDCFEQGNCQPFNHNELIFNIGSQTATQYQVSITPSYVSNAANQTYTINPQTNSFAIDIFATNQIQTSGKININPVESTKNLTSSIQNTQSNKNISKSSEGPLDPKLFEKEFGTKLKIRPSRKMYFHNYTTVEYIKSDKPKQLTYDEVPLANLVKLSNSYSINEKPYLIGRVLITVDTSYHEEQYITFYKNLIVPWLQEWGFEVYYVQEFESDTKNMRELKKREVADLLAQGEFLLWLHSGHQNELDIPKEYFSLFSSTFASYWSKTVNQEDQQLGLGERNRKIETIHTLTCYSMNGYFKESIVNYINALKARNWVGYVNGYIYGLEFLSFSLAKYEPIDMLNWISVWGNAQRYRWDLIEMIPWNYKNFLYE